MSPDFPPPFAPWDEIVYVSGPYRAPTAWQRERNIHEARRVALALWKMGFAVICPHANTAHYDGELPDHVWLQGDLALVRVSHRLVLLPTWAGSEGAIREAEEAHRFSIPVWECLDADRNVFRRVGRDEVQRAAEARKERSVAT